MTAVVKDKGGGGGCCGEVEKKLESPRLPFGCTVPPEGIGGELGAPPDSNPGPEPHFPACYWITVTTEMINNR